ncbi:hypothetical protein HK102_005579 [Quaeritorhiza haematococci]|nr:hypothetical protein HK102_005579 [Quaeritorhiza haematococci]
MRENGTGAEQKTGEGKEPGTKVTDAIDANQPHGVDDKKDEAEIIDEEENGESEDVIVATLTLSPETDVITTRGGTDAGRVIASDVKEGEQGTTDGEHRQNERKTKVISGSIPATRPSSAASNGTSVSWVSTVSDATGEPASDNPTRNNRNDVYSVLAAIEAGKQRQKYYQPRQYQQQKPGPQTDLNAISSNGTTSENDRPAQEKQGNQIGSGSDKAGTTSPTRPTTTTTTANPPHNDHKYDGFFSLRELRIAFNGIRTWEDMSGITYLPALTHVWIEGNPLMTAVVKWRNRMRKEKEDLANKKVERTHKTGNEDRSGKGRENDDELMSVKEGGTNSAAALILTTFVLTLNEFMCEKDDPLYILPTFFKIEVCDKVFQPAKSTLPEDGFYSLVMTRPTNDDVIGISHSTASGDRNMKMVYRRRPHFIGKILRGQGGYLGRRFVSDPSYPPGAGVDTDVPNGVAAGVVSSSDEKSGAYGQHQLEHPRKTDPVTSKLAHTVDEIDINNPIGKDGKRVKRAATLRREHKYTDEDIAHMIRMGRVLTLKELKRQNAWQKEHQLGRERGGDGSGGTGSAWEFFDKHHVSATGTPEERDSEEEEEDEEDEEDENDYQEELMEERSTEEDEEEGGSGSRMTPKGSASTRKSLFLNADSRQHSSEIRSTEQLRYDRTKVDQTFLTGVHIIGGNNTFDDGRGEGTTQLDQSDDDEEYTDDEESDDDDMYDDDRPLPSSIQASIRALRHALNNPISYWRVWEASYARPTFASSKRRLKTVTPRYHLPQGVRTRPEMLSHLKKQQMQQMKGNDVSMAAESSLGEAPLANSNANAGRSLPTLPSAVQRSNFGISENMKSRSDPILSPKNPFQKAGGRGLEGMGFGKSKLPTTQSRMKPKDDFEELEQMMSGVDSKLKDIENNLATALDPNALRQYLPQSRHLLDEFQKEYRRLERMYVDEAVRQIAMKKEATKRSAAAAAHILGSVAQSGDALSGAGANGHGTSVGGVGKAEAS